jgi:hypothetical protein
MRGEVFISTNQGGQAMIETFDGLPKRQAEVFEQIAINLDGGHHPATLAALVKKGYIEEYTEVVKDSMIFWCNFRVTRYRVPIGVHIRWCEWCAENYTEEAEAASQEGAQ